MFVNPSVIRLTDRDFRFPSVKPLRSTIKVIHRDFRGKNGYIMVYAPWCPHCQVKEDFWTFLARQFNQNPEFSQENFRIGVIDSSDPDTRQVVTALGIRGIPHFLHVMSDGSLKSYAGPDLSPESLIQEIAR